MHCLSSTQVGIVPNMGRRGETSEDRFGVRVKHEREVRGWSQAELADRLTAEGVKAYPTTIAKIETRSAERPRSIRLDEATALARIFGASLDGLVGQPSEFDLQDAVDLLLSAAGKARDQVQRVSASLAEAFGGLRLSVEEIAAMTDEDSERLGDSLVLANNMLASYGATQDHLAKTRRSLTAMIRYGSMDGEDLELAMEDFIEIFRLTRVAARQYLDKQAEPATPSPPIPARKAKPGFAAWRRQMEYQNLELYSTMKLLSDAKLNDKNG